MDLTTRIKQCELCRAQLPLEPRPIFQADAKAKILIAGQAPGVKAHDAGIPFNDPSGVRLRRWLGIDDATFYSPQIAIVPMGFCYPGKSRSGDAPPLKQCADTWRETLLEGMPDIELVLLVGRYAIDWHLAPLLADASSIESSAKPARKKNEKLSSLVQAYDGQQQQIRGFSRSVGLYVLPHPSPRNQIWLKQHPWFEAQRVPTIQKYVQKTLNADR